MTCRPNHSITRVPFSLFSNKKTPPQSAAEESMAISLDVHLAGREGGAKMEEITYVPFEMCEQKTGEPAVLRYRGKKDLIKRLPFSWQGEGGRGRRGWQG